MNLFVWDFHGVLEKGNDKAVHEISNQVLKSSGHKKQFTIEECYKLNGIKWYEYFEYLLPELAHEEHINLQEQCFDISNNNFGFVARNIELNDYANDVLSAIDNKHLQILISNTKSSALKLYVDAIAINRYFPEGKYFAVDAHYSHVKRTKLDVLKQFLKTTDMSFDKIVSIGDSKGDIDLAKAVNGVSYYYLHPNRGEHDSAIAADYYINDLRDIIKEI